MYNNRWGTTGPKYANGPRSVKCRCRQEPISCTPTDAFDVRIGAKIFIDAFCNTMIIKVVLTCDNTRGTFPTHCSYSQTIGTQYSSSVSHQISVSVAVESAVEASFFGLLSAGLKTSLNTGYNWRHESSEARSKQVTTTVEATAPAGIIQCGELKIRTQY